MTRGDAHQHQRLSAICCGDLGGRITEPQTDRRFAQFATDSLMWLFACDDAFCDEGAYSHDPAAMALLVAETLRTAEMGTLDTAHTPEARALCDLRNRLDELGNPSQASRWIAALRNYLGYQVCREDVLPDTIALRNEILHRYLRIREQAWPSLGPHARRFVGGLDRWIRGNLDWSLRTQRYLHPENPALIPDTVEDTAPSSSSVTPPFPSLAWWWDPRLTP